MKVSEHFSLGEFLPQGFGGAVPQAVLENVQALCLTLLEPVRVKFGPLRITSCWRLADHNAEVVGAKGSDHLNAAAADFQVLVGAWQETTIESFHWIRGNLIGKFGQVILEDRRKELKNDGKLCVHISLPTPKHPGHSDPASVLVSWIPGRYEPFTA